MPPLTIMIKPASSNCNMHCTYCFYNDESALRSTPSFGIMNTKTLELLVKKALDYADLQCTFAFQGGEPTLTGLGFYKTLLKLERKYNRKNIQIQNIIQTNGYLIDESWARFFKNNQFFVGLSLDGPRFIHDFYRKISDAKGTYAKVMHTISLFNTYRVEFNILTVVTSLAASHPSDIYRFYRANDLNFQQYIPCLNPLGAPGTKFDYSLTPELYGNFLKGLFDLWYDDFRNGRIVYISFFEDLLGILKGMPPSSCTLCGSCQKQYVSEADGSIYPCDFYALDEYCIGNIHSDSFPSLDSRRKELKFIEQSGTRSVICSFCKWYFLCKSGCRRERDTGGGKLTANYFCAAYRQFFEYSFARLQELSRLF